MMDKNLNASQIKVRLNNPTKQKIINRLKANGRLNFGRIIKDLSLNTKEGVMHIVELKSMGVVSYVNNSALIELNSDFLNSIEM